MRRPRAKLNKEQKLRNPFSISIHTAWGQMGKGWEIIRNGLAFTYDHKLLGIYRLNEKIFFFLILKIFSDAGVHDSSVFSLLFSDKKEFLFYFENFIVCVAGHQELFSDVKSNFS